MVGGYQAERQTETTLKLALVSLEIIRYGFLSHRRAGALPGGLRVKSLPRQDIFVLCFCLEELGFNCSWAFFWIQTGSLTFILGSAEVVRDRSMLCLDVRFFCSV